METTGPQLSPRLLWRIYVNDGHQELVRGAVFKQLDTRALRSDIVATGTDNYVYNRAEPLPSAIVAPSILFGELDIQRANRTREKLPTVSSAGAEFGDGNEVGILTTKDTKGLFPKFRAQRGIPMEKNVNSTPKAHSQDNSRLRFSRRFLDSLDLAIDLFDLLELCIVRNIPVSVDRSADIYGSSRLRGASCTV